MTATTPSDRARAAAGMQTQGKELSLFERKRDERIGVVKQMLPAFVDAMRDEQTARRLARDAITAIRTVPKLVETTQESFLGALMTAAQLDLRPNVGALGHGWVLPFEDKKNRQVLAQWITGYQGMVVLGARSGVSIIARTIYEHDDYAIEFGLDERLRHVPQMDPTKRGEPIAHYAIARSATGMAWTVISHDEALEARDSSPGYRFGGPSNPWRKDAENRWPMCRKTAVRRLWAFVPTDSPELAMGISADESVTTFNQSTGEILDADTGEEPASYSVTRADEEPTVVEHDPPRKSSTRRAAKTKPTEPVVDAHLPGDAPREEQPDTPTRRKLAKALMERYDQSTSRVRSAICVALNTETMPPIEYVTDTELAAATALSDETIAEWQQDRAAARDGK
jgi:recombination protein RecT